MPVTEQVVDVHNWQRNSGSETAGIQPAVGTQASSPHGTTRGVRTGWLVLLDLAPGLPSLERPLLDPDPRGRCLLPCPCRPQAVRR